jgi:hypothetical protein
MAMKFLSCPAPWAHDEILGASDTGGGIGCNDGTPVTALLCIMDSCLARLYKLAPARARDHLVSALERLNGKETNTPS